MDDADRKELDHLHRTMNAVKLRMDASDRRVRALEEDLRKLRSQYVEPAYVEGDLRFHVSVEGEVGANPPGRIVDVELPPLEDGASTLSLHAETAPGSGFRGRLSDPNRLTPSTRRDVEMTDARMARQTTLQLIQASENFLDAFTSWEAATHLDFGGGVRSSRPSASLSGQIGELLEDARSHLELNDQLRDLLEQVTHKLSTRGFIGKEEDVLRDPVISN